MTVASTEAYIADENMVEVPKGQSQHVVCVCVCVCVCVSLYITTTLARAYRRRLLLHVRA